MASVTARTICLVQPEQFVWLTAPELKYKNKNNSVLLRVIYLFIRTEKLISIIRVLIYHKVNTTQIFKHTFTTFIIKYYLCLTNRIANKNQYLKRKIKISTNTFTLMMYALKIDGWTKNRYTSLNNHEKL